MANTATIRGISIAPGIGYGRPCFAHGIESHKVAREHIDRSGNSHEIHVLFYQVNEQLNALADQAEKSFDPDSAAIFRAHRMMCEEIQGHVLDTAIQERLSTFEALHQCFDAYSEYFSNMQDDYLSDRANDFDELKRLLLDLLNNTEILLTCREYEGCRIGECVLKNEHILLTDELLANVVIRIKSHTKGIITEHCGSNSHAAVIARSLGIPVISGVQDPAGLCSHQDNLLMNGATGEIIINPDKSILESYAGHINKNEKVYDRVAPLPDFSVLADIDRIEEVNHVVRVQADGIGLYRTEFELLARDGYISESEQTRIYQRLVDSYDDKPVYFRFYDLGSDKSAPWMELDDEDNPALGCRGVRLLLRHPGIFKPQARALARVSSHRPINVIYPMVSGVEEFMQIKQLFLDATDDIQHTNIHHGIMFEVPSACLDAEELFKEIEFGRIGSNDLVQYLFARDRTSDDFQYLAMARDKALWQIIKNLSDAAAKYRKPLELCGTMTEYPEFIPELIRHGISVISTRPENVAPSRIAAASYLKSRVAS